MNDEIQSRNQRKQRRLKLSCFDQALIILGRQNRSVKEITEKLLGKNYTSDDIDESVTRLQELGYLNDVQFAKERVRSRAEFSKWGKQRIIIELKQKGVAEKYITDAIETWEQGGENNASLFTEIDEEGGSGDFAESSKNSKNSNGWQKNATEVLLRKFGAWPEDIPLEIDSGANLDWEAKQANMKQINKEKSRRLNFLIRRGFSFDEAQNALEESQSF